MKRAPEIIFYIKFDYNMNVDLGCILFEIFFCKPLFTSKTDKELFEKMYCF